MTDDGSGVSSRVPSQGVWHLGAVPLRAYALCIIVGIVAALVIGDRRWVARGGERGRHLRRRAVGGAVRPDRRPALPRHDRLDERTSVTTVRVSLRRCGSGTAASASGVRSRSAASARGSPAGDGGIPLPAFGDAIAPGIILAQAIGRLGNYFNQELYGRETDLPWGLEIYERRERRRRARHRSTASRPGELFEVVHPTFLYELLWNLLIFAAADLDRPPVQDRARPAVRAVCRGVLRRPVLDRADAQRLRDADRGHSGQLVHLDVRLHRRGRLHHGGAEGPRGSGDAAG